MTATALSAQADSRARPYPAIYNLIPLVGGIIDAPFGVFATISRIFRRLRLPDRAHSPRRPARGLTLVLGGIEGVSEYGFAMARGVLRSGYRGRVEIFPWNRCIPVVGAFRNLMSTAHHERSSDELAARIERHHSEFPRAPICLLAQSGGCWIVVRALEKLPAASRVQSAVLLAPSISPAHDITTAAARCDDGLLSLGGPGDYFFLGLGTLVFGTSDRVHSPSAGLVGWHHHRDDFVEARWHPTWLRHGYLGNHTTTAAERFIRHVIAPRFKSRRTPVHGVT